MLGRGWTVTVEVVDSHKFEHGCRRMYTGVRSVFDLGGEDSYVSTVWLPFFGPNEVLIGHFK